MSGDRRKTLATFASFATLATLGVALVLSTLTPRWVAADDATPAAPTTLEQLPEKATCRTCAVRGAGHGEESAVAGRHYAGHDYFFCSQECAQAFDGFPFAYVPQPVPRPAPAATVTTLDGEEMAVLGASVGEGAVLIDFWATWCAPCVKAMPGLNELHREWNGRGLEMIGISIDEKGEEAVSRFLRKRDVEYPLALDSSAEPAWFAYGVAAIPAMFLIDGEGQIVGEWRSEVDLDEVRKAVDELLGDRP